MSYIIHIYRLLTAQKNVCDEPAAFPYHQQREVSGDGTHHRPHLLTPVHDWYTAIIDDLRVKIVHTAQKITGLFPYWENPFVFSCGRFQLLFSDFLNFSPISRLCYHVAKATHDHDHDHDPTDPSIARRLLQFTNT